MSITLAALLLLGINGILAGMAPTPSKYHGQTVVYVRYKPTETDAKTWYDYPYHYYAYYEHHVKYIYVSSSCSAPPSSIEVCLTSLFTSMEAELQLIHNSLATHEVSIKQEMHHEHTLLYSEISWVATVQSIAKSVREAVSVDNCNLEKQVAELQLEKEQIYEAYRYVVNELQNIFVEINEIEAQEKSIYSEYQKINKAKWSIYNEISAIVYEKKVVKDEVLEIQNVVGQLNVQINKIAAKISQLTKRQKWLSEWQSKMYVELDNFHENVKEFRSVQADLHVEGKVLVAEQQRLFAEATYAKNAMLQLKKQEKMISVYLQQLQQYEEHVQQVYYYVRGEASVFISAYEEFTCEDSLLYYEACSSSTPKKATIAAPTVKAAPVAKAASTPKAAQAKSKAAPVI